MSKLDGRLDTVRFISMYTYFRKILFSHLPTTPKKFKNKKIIFPADQNFINICIPCINLTILSKNFKNIWFILNLKRCLPFPLCRAARFLGRNPSEPCLGCSNFLWDIFPSFTLKQCKKTHINFASSINVQINKKRVIVTTNSAY